MGKFDASDAQPGGQGRARSSRFPDKNPEGTPARPRLSHPSKALLRTGLAAIVLFAFLLFAYLTLNQHLFGRGNRDEAPRKKLFFVGKQAGMEDQLPIPEMPSLGPRTVYRNASMDPRAAPSKQEILGFFDSEAEYSERVAQAMMRAVGEHPHLANARANAAIFALCTNEEVDVIVSAIRQVDGCFNSRYKYPYVFVNDVPFDDHFKQSVSEATSSTVEFGVVPKQHWSLPPFLDPEAYKRRLAFPSTEGERFTQAGKPSYHLMCRYYSMYFFQHPLMLKYRYYMRIEGLTEYTCVLRYDPFLFMALYNKKYAYSVVAEEELGTVAGIWKVMQDYMYENDIRASPFLMLLHDKNVGGYNGIQLWDNFEMADLDFLRSKKYMGFMEALEQSKGFFFSEIRRRPGEDVGRGHASPTQ